MQIGEITTHNGRIAQYRHSYIEHDRPVRVTVLAVSNLPMDAYLNQFVGMVPWSPGGRDWSGEVRNMAGGRTYFDVSDWSEVKIETAIERPRDGREYGWIWSTGAQRWAKSYYERCYDCGRYHNPAFVHCEACGNVSKTGKHACPVEA